MLMFRFQAGAQSFDLLVTGSSDSVQLGDRLVYTITVTNLNYASQVYSVFVTNVLPDSVQFIGARASQGVIFTNGQVVILEIPSFIVGGIAQLVLTGQTIGVGTITNFVSVGALGAITAGASVVTEVFTGQTDLAASLTGFPLEILVNDLLPYTVGVTNQGTNAALNVELSTSLPADVTLISVTPTNQAYTFTNGSLVLSMAALAGGGSAAFRVTIQPTNAGIVTLSANVSAAGLIDSNPDNDTTATDITVGSFLAGQLAPGVISTQNYDPQTGLMTQIIGLTNIGTTEISSARVFVAGLTNQLFNAAGTNNGNPFVVYAGTLRPNQSTNLVLEYFIPTRLPITNPALTATEMPTVNLSAPSGTPFEITSVRNLPSGSLLIEFPSVPGRSYTVLYSDNAGFTNALAAQPPIVAPADRVQWIDAGPPKTLSAPASVTSRYYRVLQNQ